MRKVCPARRAKPFSVRWCGIWRSALDADYVLVGALQPDGERIATLAVHGPAGEAAAIEYISPGPRARTSCNEQVCSYPSGVQQLFPQDEMLARSEAPRDTWERPWWIRAGAAWA